MYKVLPHITSHPDPIFPQSVHLILINNWGASDGRHIWHWWR